MSKRPTESMLSDDMQEHHNSNPSLDKNKKDWYTSKSKPRTNSNCGVKQFYTDNDAHAIYPINIVQDGSTSESSYVSKDFGLAGDNLNSSGVSHQESQIHHTDTWISKRDKATRRLRQLYCKWVYTNPIPMQNELLLNVDRTFTELILHDVTSWSERGSVRYEDILISPNNSRAPVILIEGAAGMGKSTLLKKILSDWTNHKNDINTLDSFDILLYAECRSTQIKSLNDLIASLLPEIDWGYSDQNLVHSISHLKTLIIIDGLDEMNSSSAMFFREVLEFHMIYGFTVIITTRPERLITYYQNANSLNVKTKHIRVIGLSTEKRNEFVFKQYNEIQEHDQYSEVQTLLEYLDMIEKALPNILRNPFNLIQLFMFWKFNFNITLIRVPDLLFLLHQRTLERLKERLRNSESLGHLSDSVIEMKIGRCVSALCCKALVCHKNAMTKLPENICKQIQEVCFQEGVSTDTFLSTFLLTTIQRTFVNYERSHTFQGKEQQEFLAAMHLLSIVTRDENLIGNKLCFPLNSFSIPNDLQQLFGNSSAESSPPSLPIYSQNTDLTYGATSNKDILQDTRIRREFQSYSGSSTNLNLPDYQNILALLIGMFHLVSKHISNCVRVEVLNLLEEAGVNSPNNWIRVLNQITCDEFVAGFIQRRTRLLDDTEIDDETLFPYISLLRTQPPPLNLSLENDVDIIATGNIFGLEELTKILSYHKRQVRKILISDENINQYVPLFRKSGRLFLVPQLIEIDLKIKTDSVYIHELLKEVKSRHHKIRSILITDGNYRMYTSLFANWFLSSVNTEGMNIIIEIFEMTSEIVHLMRQINRLQFNVEKIGLRHDYHHLSANYKLQEEINKVFQRSAVQKYEGAVTSNVSLPSTLTSVYVSVADDNAYAALQNFLSSKPLLSRLGMCMSLDIDPDVLVPLPRPTTNPPSLILPEVNLPEDIQKVSELVPRLQPVVGDKQFYHIYFPRIKMKHPDDLRRLVAAFEGVSVYWSLVFPSSCQPSSLNDKEKLQNLAKCVLDSAGCGIEWGGIYGIDCW